MKAPPYRTIAEQYRATAHRNSVLLSRDAFLVFVCGAQDNAADPPARQLFMRYARRHLDGIDFFLAEDYFKQSQAAQEKDWLSIEDELASYADCLIVFVESPSAIAELGAFANNDRLVEVMLAVNDRSHENADSFIRHGPIAKIQERSKFAPVLYTNMSHVLTDTHLIQSKLAGVQRKRASRLEIATKEQFVDAPKKHRMLFLYELIALLSPISLAELIRFLETAFDDKGYEIRTELNMLQTLHLVEKRGQFYVHLPSRMQRFLTVGGVNLERARASVIQFYYKYERSRIELLGTLERTVLPWAN